MQHPVKIDSLLAKYKAFIFSDQILSVDSYILQYIKHLTHYKTTLFICNNIASSSQMQQKFAAYDLPVESKFILTSGDLAKNILSDSRHPIVGLMPRVYHLGEANFFDNSHDLLNKIILTNSIADAQILLITKQAFTDNIDQKTLDILMQAERANMIAITADAQYDSSLKHNSGYLAGYYANIYQNINGRVYFTSKPNSVIFYKALLMLAEFDIKDKSDILLFASDYQNDLLGAHTTGLDVAVIKNNFNIMVDTQLKPNYIVDMARSTLCTAEC